MLGLTFLIVLTIIFYFSIPKLMSFSLKSLEKKHKDGLDEYDRLLSRNVSLKEENIKLELLAEEIIALYNITKNICRSLDRQEVFKSFSEHAARFTDLKECELLSPDVDINMYKHAAVLPLTIDEDITGYLKASRVTDRAKEKFDILTQQFILGFRRAALYKKVQELAITDSLTGVFSRRYLLERLGEEFARARKFKYKFCFLMIDIDNFKDYNDRYGHLVGDAVLREVAIEIKENVRQVDLVGRYGGEEFSVILTETDVAGAAVVAERIRKAIQAQEIKVYDELLKVTISIGISVFPDSAQAALGLIDSADQALYQAKRAGRNQVQK
ncbi:MAG: GGDEF domain-containing protein [Candidatus Omnitrophota bacterium]